MPPSCRDAGADRYARRGLGVEQRESRGWCEADPTPSWRQHAPATRTPGARSTSSTPGRLAVWLRSLPLRRRGVLGRRRRGRGLADRGREDPRVPRRRRRVRPLAVHDRPQPRRQRPAQGGPAAHRPARRPGGARRRVRHRRRTPPAGSPARTGPAPCSPTSARARPRSSPASTSSVSTSPPPRPRSACVPPPSGSPGTARSAGSAATSSRRTSSRRGSAARRPHL